MQTQSKTWKRGGTRFSVSAAFKADFFVRERQCAYAVIRPPEPNRQKPLRGRDWHRGLLVGVCFREWCRLGPIAAIFRYLFRACLRWLGFP